MNLKETIQDKVVALCCTGPSLTPDIKLKDHDVVVGVNRIYLTGFVEKIDILFHNASQLDDPRDMMKVMKDKNPQAHTFFIPSAKKHPRNQLVFLDDLTLGGNKTTNLCGYRDASAEKLGFELLSGIIALEILLKFNPRHIDIYGMSFYQDDTQRKYTKYTNDKRRLTEHSNILGHDMMNNYNYFSKLIKDKNVKWHIDKKTLKRVEALKLGGDAQDIKKRKINEI